MLRASISPIKEIEKYYGNNFLCYRFDKINDKYIFVVKPYVSVLIGFFGTLSIAYIFKYLNI